MRNKARTITICTLLILLSFISNGRVAAGESQPELHSAPNAESNVDVLAITIKLAELEPYIETNYHDNESTFQVFEADKALEDGFEREIVSLAKEMIEYQNSVMQTLKRENNVSCIQNPRINDYPRLEAFFTVAEESLKQENNIKASPMRAPACGNWSYPVPDYSPSRHHYYTPGGAANFLSRSGYHRTASYAMGGGYSPAPANHDWTKGRSYSGPYGTCSSPRFRNHAITDPHDATHYSNQYGEPNPEIHRYVWPYWNWGSYVAWWHGTY